jgi:hypothetical protein
MNTSLLSKASWAVVASAFAVVLPATAETTLFTDTFDTDMDGWYFTNTSSGGLAWDRGVYDETYLPIDGWALRNLGGSSSGTRAHRSFDSVTLVDVGDYIQLTFDFSSTATSSALAVALYYTETPYTADDIGATALMPEDTVGYRFHQNWSGATDYSYLELDGTTASTLDSSSLNLQDINDSAGTLTFTITLVAEGLQMDTTINGVIYSSYIDTTPATYTINSLYLNSGNAAVFDNVSIVTNIPEPSVCGLLGGVVVAFFVGFRRRIHR